MFRLNRQRRSLLAWIFSYPISFSNCISSSYLGASRQPVASAPATRLQICTGLPCTSSSTEISVKILVELLSVLALATKQVKQGRFKKFAKKLLGEREIESVLRRLDRLTQEESRMTTTQTLEVVYGQCQGGHKWYAKVLGWK
ncbi:hypothetical protein EDB84DRAFT_1433400 [Lactarius hengduanensis]|nr:hypothetical protein EDB84DRAFT_1433400 [Lactarius hengduanensis]